MLTIASWNVNSIKARMANVVDWLTTMAPDVVCLQEIKTVDENFPVMEIEAAGYHAAVHGQKSYNGVAILSRRPIEDVSTGLPGDEADTQARYIEATISGVRVASIYLPNGNPVDTEKFTYKLAWMKRLRTRAQEILGSGMPIVLAGDYNVIPEPKDCYDPVDWEDDALYQPETRAAFRSILWLGYTEAFRATTSEANHYTFWDYQAGRWYRDEGIRIDHLLLSPPAADRLDRCWIDKDARGKEKASDHTPILVSLREAGDT